jgi:hypothetical protein
LSLLERPFPPKVTSLYQARIRTFGGNGFSRGDNLVIFYYFSTLNSSLIKRGDLWWNGLSRGDNLVIFYEFSALNSSLIKRGDLWGEWPLKRGQFSDILLFQCIEF